MRIPARPRLRAIGSTLIATASVAVAQSEPAAVSQRQDYPLNCRGGGRLLFDTLSPPSDTGAALRLSLTFAPSPMAAGPEGQGLQQGTCAWVDRPISDAEPRQVRVTIAGTDSTPGRTVRDTAVYWSFLAHNSDSGHFTAVGYRYWDASSPPLGQARQVPVAAPSKGSWLPFNPRHLHWYVLGWVAIAWVPMLMVCGFWSGWRRLAGLYPGRNSGRGRFFRSGAMVMGMTNYRGGARLTADDSHLHFSMGAFLRPGHPPFSVPWSDITASRDEWPWFPLKGHPVIRLTLARYRDLRILVAMSHGEQILAAGGGRLQLSEPHAPAAAGQAVETVSTRGA